MKANSSRSFDIQRFDWEIRFIDQKLTVACLSHLNSQQLFKQYKRADCRYIGSTRVKNKLARILCGQVKWFLIGFPGVSVTKRIPKLTSQLTVTKLYG